MTINVHTGTLHNSRLAGLTIVFLWYASRISALLDRMPMQRQQRFNIPSKSRRRQIDATATEDVLSEDLYEIQDERTAKASDIESMTVGLEKTDITIYNATLVWIPVNQALTSDCDAIF